MDEDLEFELVNNTGQGQVLEVGQRKEIDIPITAIQGLRCVHTCPTEQTEGFAGTMTLNFKHCQAKLSSR